MYRSASNVQLSIYLSIGLKCTDWPQMYRSASNVQIGLKCTAVYLSIYLSALLKSASNVQLSIGLKCTALLKSVHYEADLLAIRPEMYNRPQMYSWSRPLSIYLSALLKSASNVRTFEADFLYIWGRFKAVFLGLICTFEVHLRPIFCTFEANLIWGRCTFEADFLSASNVQILFSDWLRGITWQNKLSLPQMYIHRPQMYRIGLKCTALWLVQRENSASNVQNRPQMYRLANQNVCTFEADSLANQRAFEADSLKMFKFLTFDSNSTSDMKYQMC